MAERIGRSFADLTTLIEQILAGLKTASDAKQKDYLATLEQKLKTLRELNEKQEKAKSEFHNTSKQLKSETKESKLLVGKVISYLESEYGKTSPELEKYGIKTRQFGKGRRSTKKTNTPTT